MFILDKTSLYFGLVATALFVSYIGALPAPFDGSYGVTDTQQPASTSLYKEATYTNRINEIYDQEVAPRFPQGHHYLDYTGSGVYLLSQLSNMADELATTAFGNPHSVNPSSMKTTKVVEEMRTKVLAFFGANPEEYDVIFTRSATAALQKLGESFPFTTDSHYTYTVSNHNSVLGIREYARQAGSHVSSISEDQVEDWLADQRRQRDDTVPSSKAAREEEDISLLQHKRVNVTYSLFAFPGEDNFAGVLFPLRDWTTQVQALSTPQHKWKVVLDAAAFVPKHQLNLSETPADYVCISFYKLFGLPTGVGAWLIRKESDSFLHKAYWGGGSVFTATSELFWHVRNGLPAKFEDGTLPFLDIVALRHGFDAIESLGGMSAVETHIQGMGARLHDGLLSLTHSNGQPMLQLFGKHYHKDWQTMQSAVANFLLIKPTGTVFSYKTAALEFADAGIHIRDGCMCNPGACYRAVGVTDEEVKALAKSRHHNFTDWEYITVERGGKAVTLPLGTLRVSLGYMTRPQDVDALIEFIERKYKDRSDDSRSRKENERFAVEYNGGC